MSIKYYQTRKNPRDKTKNTSILCYFPRNKAYMMR